MVSLFGGGLGSKLQDTRANIHGGWSRGQRELAYATTWPE